MLKPSEIFHTSFDDGLEKMLGSPVNVRLIKLALLFRGFTQS